MRSRSRRPVGYLAATALICGSLHTEPAWSQTDEERAGARTLATEGAKAFAAQRWPEAIDLFTRAEALVHAPTHLLFLARARVKLGQFVLARETYTRIVRENFPASAPAAFLDAQTAARAELPTIEPRIAMLTVTVTGADGKAVSVTVDGQKLSSVFVGAPKPIDPGEHKIQATGDGLVSELLTLHVKEGARESVSLALMPRSGTPPVTMPAPPGLAPMPPTPTAPHRVDPSTPDVQPAEGASNGLRIGSYAALGVGVVGLGAGTVFGLQSLSKRSSADDLCPDANRCPLSQKDQVEGLDNDARKAQTLATIGLVVGGVGVAAGITLLVLSGRKHDQSAHRQGPTMHPWVGLRAAGVSGTF